MYLPVLASEPDLRGAIFAVRFNQLIKEASNNWKNLWVESVARVAERQVHAVDSHYTGVKYRSAVLYRCRHFNKS